MPNISPLQFRTRKPVYAAGLNLVAKSKATASKAGILISSPNPVLLSQLVIKLEWKEETCSIITISHPQPRQLCIIILMEKLKSREVKQHTKIIR